MKKKEFKNNFINNQSMKLFFMLCLYFLTILVLYSMASLINIKNILGLIQIIALLVPIFYSITDQKGTKQNNSIMIVFIFLTVILPYISGKTYDLTVDGNTYHKTAIAFIKNGWNPLYESARSFQKHNANVVLIEETSRIDLWIEHYPKATWIIAATIYNFTGNIESGKCITLILLVMVAILCYNILRKILDTKWSILFSLLLSFNPIVLAQLFSYYVDGIMGICFIIELLLLFCINPMEKQDKTTWVCIISIITIFTNLKFTGLMCSGVIAAIFYFYWFLKYNKEKQFKERYINITKLFTIAYLIAIFLVGSNSYIKNTVEHHNPLYPLVGKDKVDIITTMQPKKFSEMNMVSKFAYSLFSMTENAGYSVDLPTLKLPFKIYKSELENLYAPDTRIGGFGPLFALIFISSMIIFIPAIYIFIKREKANLKYITISILSIIISMVILGENWWARYVPQLYYLVIGNFILAVYILKYLNKQKLVKLYIIGSLIIIAANTAIFLRVDKLQLNDAKLISKDLAEMKKQDDLNISIQPEMYGYQYVLKDQGIKYTMNNDIAENHIRYKYCWRIGVEVHD